MDESKTQVHVTTRTTSTSRVTKRRVAAPSPADGKKRVNRSYALISLLIGALLWFGVDMKRKVDQILDVEVEFTRMLPADWKIISRNNNLVKVTVRGTQQEVDGISKDELMIEPEFPPGSLDGDTFDGTLNLLPAQVRGLPAGVEVLSISPSVTTVRLSKTITQYVPVKPGVITGTPQEGYIVGRIRPVDPPAMPITASKELLSKVTAADAIVTKDFSVDGARGLVGGLVGLEPFEIDGERVPVPGTVYMTVELDEKAVERTFEQPFEVRALIESPFDRYGQLNITPPSARVTVSGPQSIIDKLSANEIIIYADLRDRVPAAPGEFNIKCKAITPSRVRIVRIEPDTVKWIMRDQIVPLEPLG
jgi:Uncharacterized protein conserved in bacteria